jgi:hypothetical protein
VKKIGVAECCEDVSWVGEKVKRLCKPVLSGKRADSATVDRQRAKQRGRRNRATSGIDTVRGQTVDERRAGKERGEDDGGWGSTILYRKGKGRTG